MSDKKPYEPSQVFQEFLDGTKFKSSIGNAGLYDQNKKNERFYSGDQWYGVNCGTDRPLIRHNVIKRIGDYKMGVIGSSPVAVNYSADGVPNTLELKDKIKPIRMGLASSDVAARANAVEIMGGMESESVPTPEEITLIMSALSDYFRVTSERLKFDDIKTRALRNAYISGTGIIYTYWDSSVRTGLYADESRTTPVKGDIRCECLNVENVYFGDPNMDSIQDQPYILIVQRKSVAELKREAKRNRIADYDRIAADSDTSYQAGQYSENEPTESLKATVITKFWKEYDENGEYKIMAVKVCNTVTIRRAWDIGVRLYPFAKYGWLERNNSAYSESEITYLIPNQIAINRMITASVWAVMMMGMPIMVVNNDIVTGEITNDPGQIINVTGGIADVQGAVRYVNPPNFSPEFINNVNSVIGNTLQQSGANDAALGDMRPENTSAIYALREAADMPLQQDKNRFYSFIEDVARIWAEFWVMQYGNRSLKVEDDTGTWYLPFKADRYKDLLIATRIDVGASGMWSEFQSIQTLDNLFERQIIDAIQYLQRLPNGTIPKLTKLIDELKAANTAVQTSEAPQVDMGALVTQLAQERPDLMEQLMQSTGAVL